jgi:hypothetical protein
MGGQGLQQAKEWEGGWVMQVTVVATIPLSDMMQLCAIASKRSSALQSKQC